MKLFAYLPICLFIYLSTSNNCFSQPAFQCGMVDNQDSILHVRSDQEYSNYCNSDMKYFRVNYHFIQDDNGNLNMTETDDGGLGFTNLNGYEYAEEMIKEANRQHSLNQDHFLKDANHTYTPIPEIPIRYVLAGVYFHQSTAARNAHHYN